MPRYAKFAWGVLVYNLVVILWGAFVRATGSGAGCGGHWPLCNGEIVPHAPVVETVIEFSHRLTSGLAALLVVGLVVNAWRAFPRGHPVRLGAALSAVFMVVEVLVGASLVLLDLVGANSSPARGFWSGGHLLNTFILVACLTLTAWWASGGGRLRLGRPGVPTAALLATLAGVLIVAATGAVTALGDTLFPSSHLLPGRTQPVFESVHVFVRLRVWHPVLALLVGGLVLYTTRSITAVPDTGNARKLAVATHVLYGLQLLIGAVNVWFLAPLGLQLLHLFVSELVRIVLVLTTAIVLGESSARPMASGQ